MPSAAFLPFFLPTSLVLFLVTFFFHSCFFRAPDCVSPLSRTLRRGSLGPWFSVSYGPQLSWVSTALPPFFHRILLLSKGPLVLTFFLNFFPQRELDFSSPFPFYTQPLSPKPPPERWASQELSASFRLTYIFDESRKIDALLPPGLSFSLPFSFRKGEGRLLPGARVGISSRTRPWLTILPPIFPVNLTWKTLRRSERTLSSPSHPMGLVLH